MELVSIAAQPLLSEYAEDASERRQGASAGVKRGRRQQPNAVQNDSERQAEDRNQPAPGADMRVAGGGEHPVDAIEWKERRWRAARARQRAAEGVGLTHTESMPRWCLEPKAILKGAVGGRGGDDSRQARRRGGAWIV